MGLKFYESADGLRVVNLSQVRYMRKVQMDERPEGGSVQYSIYFALGTGQGFDFDYYSKKDRDKEWEALLEVASE